MASGDLKAALEQLRRVLPQAGATDAQLLERFVVARDEAAFEALVSRHGPMVLGVCRRLLGNAHDAEDAFQATFLILARKAASVVKRDSVGGWLYAVTQRIAQEARAVIARRRARERQVENIPHPEVAPAEPEDWRPILEREVARLPHRYREAVVLYHLEGWSHREAAAKLGVPEGTLASRLVMARRMLARRLARSGLPISGIALVSVLSERLAPAAVRAPLAMETTRAAALVAAGRLAAVSTPAALLTKGVLTTMFLKKLKLVVGAVMLVAVLGATGLAYRAGAQAPSTDEAYRAGAQAPSTDKPRVEKPLSEVEALRRENELLKLNLLVVLEKVRSQEAELRALRRRERAVPQAPAAGPLPRVEEYLPVVEGDRLRTEYLPGVALPKKAPPADTVRMVEEALKALKSSHDAEGQRRAAETLEKVLRNLKEQPKKP
jgi:RNA polymerase sigma factor (sigma-70 family)